MNGSHLYWTNYGDTNLDWNSGTIWESGLDGSNPQAIVTGQSGTTGLAVDDSHLYWDNAGAITQAGLDGSSPQAIVTGQSAWGLAVSS